MSKQAESADQMLRRLELRRRRWQIQNGRLIVEEPEAVVWWLDREIEEMEAGR
ncbi:hypothetical protein NSS79_15295 [Paenibacillus sp. FSL L8-0436]|uniref:hypothetical protein n=1 Tax=Paenibacillus sp. FSL L8-0436 TaxID=2954686 RepID=UPI0031583841